HAVKKGGIIILIGSCREGLGNETFAKWMDEAEKPDDLVDRLNERFTLGGHKAAAIALVMRDADICLVSDMDPDYVKSIFFTPFRTAQEALDAALEKKGPSAKVLVMPHGGSVLPRIAG
ncbi:MAG: hypothetical protein VZQ84_02910, partial [Anaerovoracaceae bacterium]|nr:hypothetical protein [Anaerovoracaceae bacterium]